MVMDGIDFACLTDQHGKCVGSVSIRDMLGRPPLSPVSAAPISSFPTVFSHTPLDEILNQANWESAEYLVVTDKAGKFAGVIMTRELLLRQLSRLNMDKRENTQVLETLGYGYLLVSRAGLVHISPLAYQMLKKSDDHELLIADLPGAPYIETALESGACYSDLQIEYAGGYLLMNILPAADTPGTILVTIGDTSRIRHFLMLQTIFGSMREAVNVVDEQGIITYCNYSSARYVYTTPEKMVGNSITKYYPKAVLLKVIRTHRPYSDERLAFDGRIFIVNAVPLFVGGVFKGGIAIFREITEILQLTAKLASMEEQLNSMQLELNMSKHADAFNALVGANGSLKHTVEKAQRCIAALGGPRHCIISGETGTGKTSLAKSMYYFAKKIQVINGDAPFIEINCAQFTNSDIAAMEIFGSEKGSFTGALDKEGLIELADGGILFLDEAHALGPYQTMLLKIIEEGMHRRIGGRSDKKISVIIIAASSQNLREALLPELYQRLAQYQLSLTPLRLRPDNEKKAMLHSFCLQYEHSAKNHYGIDLKLTISPQAENLLLSAYYPRNIRQFRDIVNSAVDAAVPPVFSARDHDGQVIGVLDVQHLPPDLLDNAQHKTANIKYEKPASLEDNIWQQVAILRKKGLGPRKIAKALQSQGIALEYYQIAYRLRKNNSTVD